MLTYVMGSSTAWLERRERHKTPWKAYVDYDCDYEDRILFVYKGKKLVGVFDLTEAWDDLGAVERFDHGVEKYLEGKIK
jgi:hypothetical protein